ncbi:hypothetical protein JCM13664_05780 [Methylothermus subterraneus]
MKNSDKVEIARWARVKVRKFRFPPVRCGLVLGRKAAVGCHALRKALHLLMAAPFAHLELKDEVISDLIVRESVLKRFPQEQLIAFVLEHVKPLMSADEILELEIDTEVLFKARLGCQERSS